jgi:SAM-dependent methyltransferase
MDPRLLKLAEYLENNPQESKGHIYHPLPFKEFAHLQTSSNPKSALHKWEIIMHSLPDTFEFGNARILDVGANIGFYSMSFALLGAEVDAFEPNRQYYELGEKISSIKRLNIHWHNKSIALDDIRDKSYDIVLMLSVFQWISQGNKFLTEAIQLLRNVNEISNVLFFELGCNSGKSSIQVSTIPIVWIWNLLNNLNAKNVYYLGSSSAWKWSRRYLFACSRNSMNLDFWQRTVTKLLPFYSS